MANRLLTFAILCACAALGLLLSIQLVPGFDTIWYPFAPNFRVWAEENSIVLRYAFIMSILTSLAGIVLNTCEKDAIAATIIIYLYFRISAPLDIRFAHVFTNDTLINFALTSWLLHRAINRLFVSKKSKRMTP